MKNENKINKKYIALGLVVLAIAFYFVFHADSATTGLYTVATKDVAQTVVLSGTVKTSDKADLGFASSGRISKIFVRNNQAVAAGQILAQLEVDDLLADLKIKQANYKTSDLDLESAVENKYRTLLSDGLVLVPDSAEYNVEPPTVSGIYDGAEGTYKISIAKDNPTLADIKITTFNLEKTKVVMNDSGSTKLGSHGLYLSFPETDHDLYDGTIWYLDIPNKASSEYLANYNAYLDAKKRLDSSYTNTSDASSLVAQAEIQKINAQIKKSTIYAPFSGKVTNIEKEVGENASVGENVMSMIGSGGLEVVMQVSELDVSRIATNAPIEITLDAFPGEVFSGLVKTINSRDTQVDGVSVYEAFVELKRDDRIKTGMSANGTITIARKTGVLAIPSYYVKKVDGKNFVELVSPSGDTVETEVTLGLVGTDSTVEVTSGLQAGDQISTTAKK